MGYYTRVFCTSDAVPTVKAVEAALHDSLPSIRLIDQARDASRLLEADLVYDPAKKPVAIEVGVNEGPDSLAAEECEEFVEEIGPIGRSAVKRRLVKHLRKTKFIVRCQLFSDIDDAGYEANGQLMDYFVNEHGGLVHADGEGFYEGTKLVLEL
jgi:hypothetical protein